MHELDFKPNILSPEYIKEHGVLYDEDVFYSEDYEWEALYDKAPELGGKPFTGLLYELDMNGIIRYYQYYKDGFGDGEYVEFYDNGAVASYCIMKEFAFVDKLYQWHKNGVLKSFNEIDKKRRYIKTIHFDEDGNMIFLMEKGKVKIDKRDDE